MKTTLTREKRDGSAVEVPAPNIVKTYTEQMGGVDLADQNKARYSISASVITTKWWFRLFTGLLDMALANSWQLYKHRVDAEGRLNHQDFLLAVADGFLAEARASLVKGKPVRGQIPLGHELVLQAKISRYVVCNTPAHLRRTMWMSAFCQYARHAEKCFYQFHTVDYAVSHRYQKRTCRVLESQ